MSPRATRDQRDRLTPWILLLVLTLVLWLGLKLDAGAASTAPRNTTRPVVGAESETGRGPVTAGTARESIAPSGPYLEPEELPGFGGEGLLPALFDALNDADCDLDDPFSNCQ